MHAQGNTLDVAHFMILVDNHQKLRDSPPSTLTSLGLFILQIQATLIRTFPNAYMQLTRQLGLL